MKKPEDFDLENPGWMNRFELDRIRFEVARASTGAGHVAKILELGCYAGRTTRVLLEASSPCGSLVVAVDPLARNRHMPTWPTPGAVHVDTLAHMRRLVAENANRLIVFQGWAEEIAGLFRAPIDALIIDTEHSYDPTIRQVDVFAPLVRDGGVIILDDYDLEPVASGWRDSQFAKARPWLTVDTLESIAVVRVGSKPKPDALPDLTEVRP